MPVEEDAVAAAAAEGEEELLRVAVPELPPPSDGDRASFAKCGLLREYTYISTLGKGAFGCVFAAAVEGQHDVVAVKAIQNPDHMYKKGLPDPASLTRRIFRELYLGRGLRHPNIVGFIGAADLRCAVQQPRGHTARGAVLSESNMLNAHKVLICASQLQLQRVSR